MYSNTYAAVGLSIFEKPHWMVLKTYGYHFGTWIQAYLKTLRSVFFFCPLYPSPVGHNITERAFPVENSKINLSLRKKKKNPLTQVMLVQTRILLTDDLKVPSTLSNFLLN